jgi:hypothetical protein
MVALGENHRRRPKHACDQKAQYEVISKVHDIAPSAEPTAEMANSQWTFPRSAKGPRVCRHECPLLALCGHPNTLSRCPLLGVKRTSLRLAGMSAFDPKRTSEGSAVHRAERYAVQGFLAITAFSHAKQEWLPLDVMPTEIILAYCHVIRSFSA